jgi:hypothetical protein
MATVADEKPRTHSDVAEFVARAGLKDVWLEVLALTQSVFPSARFIVGYLEDDPDIAGQRYLVCNVALPGRDTLPSSDAWEEWHRRIGQHVPPKQVGVFRLRVELRD